MFHVHVSSCPKVRWLQLLSFSLAVSCQVSSNASNIWLNEISLLLYRFYLDSVCLSGALCRQFECSAKWLINGRPVFDSKTSATKDGRLIGNLTRKDCTITLNCTQYARYIFRLECQNSLKYSFSKHTLALSAKGKCWCLLTLC